MRISVHTKIAAICSLCKEAHPRSVCPRRSWFQNILNIHPSTPINIESLATELSFHPDRGFLNHLLTGPSQGFQVLAEPTETYIAKNLQSAMKEPGTVACRHVVLSPTTSLSPPSTCPDSITNCLMLFPVLIFRLSRGSAPRPTQYP